MFASKTESASAQTEVPPPPKDFDPEQSLPAGWSFYPGEYNSLAVRRFKDDDLIIEVRIFAPTMANTGELATACVNFEAQFA